MERDKTSINSFFQNEESLKKKYLKLLNKYIKLRSVLMSLNHKLITFFDEDTKEDERF